MRTKPASSVAPVQSMVIRLRERVETAEDWASSEQHRSIARELCNLSDCCNTDDIYIDTVGLLIELLEPRERLVHLVYELDVELDGVKLPASAAGILNGIRRVLDDLSDG